MHILRLVELGTHNEVHRRTFGSNTTKSGPYSQTRKLWALSSLTSSKVQKLVRSAHNERVYTLDWQAACKEPPIDTVRATISGGHHTVCSHPASAITMIIVGPPAPSHLIFRPHTNLCSRRLESYIASNNNIRRRLRDDSERFRLSGCAPPAPHTRAIHG